MIENVCKRLPFVSER